MRRAAFASFVLVLTGTAALAGPLPDGDYDCAMDSGGMLMGFGTVEIRGSEFRGPAYDGDYGPAAGYDVNAEGVVTWGGPFGTLDNGEDKVVSTVWVPKPDSGQPFLRVTVETSRGTFHTID
jgi:hypothetical protein